MVSPYFRSLLTASIPNLQKRKTPKSSGKTLDRGKDGGALKQRNAFTAFYHPDGDFETSHGST
jgi:hypothetical protein